MRRRKFIKIIVGSVAAWPLASRAQQLTMPVIGFLSTASPNTAPLQIQAFRDGLSEAGFVDGRNVVIEYRWAESHYDRLPVLVADLVHRQVAVIVATFGDVGILAAKAATSTIPIVFTTGSVRSGFVESLNRPGGNVTGISFFTTGLLAKRLGLLLELVPSVTSVGVLVDPISPESKTQIEDILTAARERGRQLHIVNASTESELDVAFRSFVERRIGALLVSADPFFTTQRAQIVTLAARYAIPASYGRRDFANAGGLMGYGTSLIDGYHQAGIYTGRILKGDKPSDLPVLQPTKFEFAINLKTAKALGLTVPPGLLAIADEVTE
jgi:putative ABC transport system substrate-binding protein